MRTVYRIITLLAMVALVACGQAEPEAFASPTSTVVTPTPQIGVSLVTRAVPTTAVVQTSPTPFPSPTVTPTATPVIYQIAAGDTLLGIAIQWETTVDAILALNPGIVPENLQIGQPVILPPPPTPSTQLVQGTPIPLRVTVTQIKTYQTPQGSLWLLGEVSNDGAEPVENIQVEIDLQAADGRSLGTVSAWAATSIILPGGRAPFGLLLGQPPSEMVQPAVTISGGQVVVELGNRFLETAVVGVEFRAMADSVTLSGKIVNDGLETAVHVQLIATFYDGQGNISGYQQLMAAASLEAGEERPFLIAAAPPGGETASYTLQTEALRTAIDN